MKKHIKQIIPGLVTALLLLVVSFGAVHAASTNTPLASSLIIPASQEDSTTIDQRLAARRPKVQLSAADKANIAAKCSLAQTAINTQRTSDTKAAAIRLETYNELVKRLSFLVDNLSSQGDDASQLLNAQNYFIASINNYLTDDEAYKVDMDDLVTMNCAADAAGFQATLVDARAVRVKLASDVSLIKNNNANLQKNLAAMRQLLITKGVK